MSNVTELYSTWDSFPNDTGRRSSTIDLQQLLAHTRREVDALIESDAASLLFRVPADMPYQFQGNERLLRQVLVNRTQRALRYAHTGVVDVRLGISEIQRGSAALELEVKYMGPSDPPDPSDRIAKRMIEFLKGSSQFRQVSDSHSVFSAVLPVGLPAPSTTRTDLSDICGMRIARLGAKDVDWGNLRHLLNGWGTTVENADTAVKLKEFLAPKSEALRHDLLIIDRVAARQLGIQGHHLAGIRRDLPVLYIGPPGNDASLCEKMVPTAISFQRVGGLEALHLFHALRLSRLLSGFPIVHNDTGSERTKQGPAQRILCIDDNRVNLAVIVKVLQAAGHTEVTAVTSGLSALAAVTSDSYDLVVADHKMPGMSGLDAFRRYRNSREPHERIPWIILTAKPSDALIQTAHQQGVSGVIGKSSSYSKLVQLVDEIAQHRILENTGETA